MSLVGFLLIVSSLFSPFYFFKTMPEKMVIFPSSFPPLPVPALNLEKRQLSFLSAIALANPNFWPIRDWGIDEPELDAKAGLISLKNSKILYQKNIDQILPIASITKLMTALIVLENIDPKEITIISEKALEGYGQIGNLKAGEKISIENLLYALLMESSNDAALALAEAVEQKTSRNFVELMNVKAEQLGLENTHFTEPSGYESTNVSTAQEISRLVGETFSQPLIWQILKTPTIDLANHHWVNTDELLNRLPDVIGGKTGYTEEAQGCLVLVVRQPSSQKDIISVVLGAEQRFLETEKLINWVKTAYKWQIYD